METVSEYHDRAHIKSYVKRALRMSEHQRRAYDRLAPVYCVPFAAGHVDPADLFPEQRERVVLEIGFGMGAATAELASVQTNTNFLGVEVYKPGVGKLLSLVEEHGLENVRIIHHDAVLVLEEMIRPASLDGIHFFFPDPWPKKRHHKRRIIRPELTPLFASRLKPGGYLYFVTDWAEYAERALEVLEGERALCNAHDGFAEPVSWRPATAFEAKAERACRPVREMYFVRCH
jgi:tRNA (guanine-N7-)-methyltransferase